MKKKVWHTNLYLWDKVGIMSVEMDTSKLCIWLFVIILTFYSHHCDFLRWIVFLCGHMFLLEVVTPQVSIIVRYKFVFQTPILQQKVWTDIPDASVYLSVFSRMFYRPALSLCAGVRDSGGVLFSVHIPVCLQFQQMSWLSCEWTDSFTQSTWNSLRNLFYFCNVLFQSEI